MTFDRRAFLAAAALIGAAVDKTTGQESGNQSAGVVNDHDHAHDHASHEHPKPSRPAVPRLPALICRRTSTTAIDAAYKMLTEGHDTLDAALHLTQTQESDPNDNSAGIGGLPNEDCEVELDACCLHGPSRRSASVGAVKAVKNPSLLARCLMEQTAYPTLVGDQARSFARTQNFTDENLLTDRTRKMFAVWKQMSPHRKPAAGSVLDLSWPRDSRASHFLPRSQEELDNLVRQGEPLAAEAGLDAQQTWRAVFNALFPTVNPLYVSTINQKGELSCAATTSGLPWRMAGILSDTAILGAGCCLDPDVGSAGACGDAEANIKVTGAHLIVEAMRRGSSPQDAGLEALNRIVSWYRSDMTQLRFVDMLYFILRKDGAYACVSLWHGDRTGHVQQFTIHDGLRRTEDCAFLIEGSPANGPQAKAAAG